MNNNQHQLLSATQMNEMGTKRIPFLFIIDFEQSSPFIMRLDNIPDNLIFDFNGVSNSYYKTLHSPDFIFEKHPISFAEYKKGFDLVRKGIMRGDSFLLNLSYPTGIVTDLSLDDIYRYSEAKYKLKYGDRWVVFSPESFVKIKEGEIFSYPMKGTIDARLPKAAETILADYKETAEHNTIVDLIRNDLSRVAKKVRVKKYRYLDKITTNQKSIYQVSSEIVGILPYDYHKNIGDIIWSLLPAGSISGAPKPKTIQIIQAAEGQPRGYYTGIAGIFDGENLDSCVLIRFIEQKDGKLQYRSGGGITHLSNAKSEYQELIDKVYVPIYRKHPHPQWSAYASDLS